MEIHHLDLLIAFQIAGMLWALGTGEREVLKVIFWPWKLGEVCE